MPWGPTRTHTICPWRRMERTWPLPGFTVTAPFACSLTNGGAWAPLGGDGLGGLAAGGASTPSLAYNSGSLFAAWVASDGLRNQIFAARFNGSTWSPAGSAGNGSQVSASTVNATGPRLAASSGGLVLAWADVWNIADTTRDVIYAMRWNGSAFSANLPGDASGAGLSATSGTVQGITLAVNPAGQPFVAWNQGAAKSPTTYVVGNTLEPDRVFYVNGGTSGGIYTTAAGNSTSSGLSPAAPLDSIQDLIADYTLQPGDVILIDPGVYTVPESVTSAAGGVTFVGAPDNGTTLEFAGSVSSSGFTLQDVVISGGLTIIAGSGFTLRDSSADSVTIQGGSAAFLTDDQIAGLSVTSSASGTDVEANSIGASGVFVSGATGLILRGNTIRAQNGANGITISGASYGTISGNDVTASGSALAINATFGGAITGNSLHDATVGLAYGAAAAVGNNQIFANVTGVSATVIDPASAFGFVGAPAPTRSYGNVTGVDLLGQMQGQHIFANSTGVIGDGTLGGSDFSNPNVIESNGVGVDFAGTIQFNQIAGNTIGVEVRDFRRARR